MEQWKEALQDIDLYDKNGNFIETYYDQLLRSAEEGNSSIDTVLGDLMEEIQGYDGISQIAFSHIVNNDDGTYEFLGQKTAEEYIYGILDISKKDGDLSIDHILELDKKGIQDAEVYNAQGEQVGQTCIFSVISTIRPLIITNMTAANTYIRNCTINDCRNTPNKPPSSIASSVACMVCNASASIAVLP